ncbi:ADP-glucose pyrophosphorylase small subunit 2 [Actinidia rufa]|uniref:ADP-glucose pyrophosphorylase small subunit 2 n=1 Tax=Actinidia rufa TaxID=165716 RepID=A0A7J0E3Y9_9ERIC|nr:ADP-glucose pyrophosphorylase small subunit 2 [Actinidia rufa]
MVALQLSLLTSAKLKTKLPIRGLDQKTSPISTHQASFKCSNRPSVAAIVFGDGSDSRLYPLTKRRSEGAIPIAANYRLIDAVVSNCINSNINKIYALTQFNSTSLNSHLTRAYSGAGLGKDGFVEVIAAYQSPEDNGWFQGTADAIRRCLWVLEEYPILEFLVLPGHHLYRMDYQKLIDAHRKKKSDVTCAVLTPMIKQDSEYGIFKVNFENKVTEFREKPEKKVEGKLNEYAHNNFPGMGIYVINRDVMIKLLTEHFPKANDLRSEIIPGAISLGMKPIELTSLAPRHAPSEQFTSAACPPLDYAPLALSRSNVTIVPQVGNKLSLGTELVMWIRGQSNRFVTKAEFALYDGSTLTGHRERRCHPNARLLRAPHDGQTRRGCPVISRLQPSYIKEGPSIRKTLWLSLSLRRITFCDHRAKVLRGEKLVGLARIEFTLLAWRFFFGTELSGGEGAWRAYSYGAGLSGLEVIFGDGGLPPRLRPKVLRSLRRIKVLAYHFDGYWEDMRSIEAFYQANMESTKKTNVGYNFYDKDSPLYTLPRYLPPSLVTGAVITDSVIGDGCILNNCNIKGTVIGLRTRVGDGAVIEDSVLMGSDIYQTNGIEGKGIGIPIGIGECSHIKKAIVDKNARIGKNVMIINKDKVQEANMEAYGYTIKEGIVIILRKAVIPDGSIL